MLMFAFTDEPNASLGSRGHIGPLALTAYPNILNGGTTL